MPTGYSKLTGKNPFKGKRRKFSPEHIEKIRLANTGRVSLRKGKSGFSSKKKGRKYPHLEGEGSAKWKGGTWKYWRLQALVRDNYTCQVCQLRDIEIMEVDHIKSKKTHPDLVFEMNNLVTLCPNCHSRKTIRNKEYANHE